MSQAVQVGGGGGSFCAMAATLHTIEVWCAPPLQAADRAGDAHPCVPNRV